MGKRILITLCVAALGVAAWWVMRPTHTPEEGLVVHVEVVDQDGAPLPKAQVETTFKPGWQAVDGQGRRRLTRVVLRADEAPSARALMAAIQVRARFYTLRRGFEPLVEERADGSWSMRFPLHHHGVLRLNVADTHSGEVKAFLAPDPLERWEAMDRGNVARPGSPAAYRIYPGFEKVGIHLVGLPDKEGAVGVATRRFFVDPPGSGHVIERTVEPDAVTPILGQVVPPEGPTPPSLAGSVLITELGADGARLPHATLPIESDGSFVVRTVGAGDYELEARLDFFPNPLTVLVIGGDVIELKPEKPAYWAVLEHPELDLRARQAECMLRVPGVAKARRVSAFFGKGKSVLPLPGTGAFACQLAVTGTNTAAPLDGACVVEARAPGPVSGTLEIRDAPAGTLVLHTTKASWTEGRGATVWVEGRKATLMRGLREGVTFQNVRVRDGTPGTSIRIDWDDPRAASNRASVLVKAGETIDVTLDRKVGGRIGLRILDARFALRGRPLPIRLRRRETDPTRLGETFTPRNRRRGPLPIWDLGEALTPGRYEGSMLELNDSEAGARGLGFEFEILPGETILVDVKEE